ncbi:MAG: DUF123 domain-containing protein [Candidatus Nezhaarchaeota archaeon]|nr:DUF123 domain-containing protein [Candidatus Nezhaarchaeota archaeon]
MRLRPGRLGRTLLDEGVYAYVGSALSPGSLPKRVARHIVKEKKLRWHIDYLLTLPEANVEAVVAAEAIRRVECVIALLLMRSGFNQAIAKFGSSDCSCPSHLLKSPLLSVRGAAILVSSLIESLGLRPKVAWLR